MRRRWRRPVVPSFRTSKESGLPTTAWNIVPDWNKPAGGPRKQYRTVDVLNSAGIRSAVVHHKRGFRCDWFQNSTVVTPAADVVVSAADIIVVPEIYGSSIRDLPKGVRQVIFNQNAYLTLDSIAANFASGTSPYIGNPDLAAVVTVSDNNAQLLRYAFPDLPVHRIRWSIDPEIYAPAPYWPGRRIAFMPRRRSRDSAQVLALLRLRGVLNGWEVVEIENRSESEAAELMRSCRIFLSFSEREGFGLPPLEAMACGCLIVGYTGYAGVEYFKRPFATAVEDGDVAAFASEVERIMAWTESDQSTARKVALEGSQFALTGYTEAMERRAIVDLFRELVK